MINFMGRKTLGSYVKSRESVAGVRFSGNFGSQDGDLIDYTFIDSNFLNVRSVVDLRLTNGIYNGLKQFPIIVSSHLSDYGPAEA
jgi:hypothetical protein